VVQLPRVVENMLDAKEELEGKLRIAINAFTSGTAGGIVGVLEGMAWEGRGKGEVRGAAGKFREEAERMLPVVQQKTEEYIADSRTTDILVNAIMVFIWGIRVILGISVDGV